MKTNEVNQKVEQIGKEIVSFRDYTLKSINGTDDKIYYLRSNGKTLFSSLSYEKAIGYMKGYLAAKYGEERDFKHFNFITQ